VFRHRDSGAYVKLGGQLGGTEDLQEAQVFGWAGGRAFSSYASSREYEMVPVKIVEER
jgi:hypothetical protein